MKAKRGRPIWEPPFCSEKIQVSSFINQSLNCRINSTKTAIHFVLTKFVGGTAWESNPPDQARWSQAVLKTVLGISENSANL
jgi:hypothetical protein